MPTYTFADSNRYLDQARAPITLVNTGEKSFKTDLQSVTEGLQAERSAALLQMRELQLAAQLLLGAEGARLAQRDPQDARIAALAQGAASAHQRAEVLEQEAAIASIRVPRVRKTEALLHGRITDEADRATGPVTVTLLSGGKPVAGVAPVEVDSAGYYALVVPPEAAARIAGDAKLGLRVDHGDAHIDADAPALTLAASQVQVHDLRLSAADLDKLKLGAPRVAPRQGKGKK